MFLRSSGDNGGRGSNLELVEIISVDDLALSNAYQLEAMINVLERKGLLTNDEVLAELEIIAATNGKKVN